MFDSQMVNPMKNPMKNHHIFLWFSYGNSTPWPQLWVAGYKSLKNHYKSIAITGGYEGFSMPPRNPSGISVPGHGTPSGGGGRRPCWSGGSNQGGACGLICWWGFKGDLQLIYSWFMVIYHGFMVILWWFNGGLMVSNWILWRFNRNFMGAIGILMVI